MSRIKITARVLIECLFDKESKLTMLKSESWTVMIIPKRRGRNGKYKKNVKLINEIFKDLLY